MHIKTVFIYLKIWRRDKLGIFTHFTFTNLPRSSQSMNSLVYVYSTQIPSWSHSWSHFFVLLPPKKFSVLPPDGFFVLPPDGFVFDLGISTNKGRVSTRSGKSRNLLKDQENSGKFDIFLKKVREKSGKKIFIHANF